MTRHSSTAPRRRRTRAVGVLVLLGVLTCAAVLTAVTSAGDRGQVVSTRALAAEPTTEPTEPIEPVRLGDGERVYLRDCAWCHGDQGEGSQRAPGITDAGEAGTHFQLTTGRMPLQSVDDKPEPGPPAYPPDTIRDLVGYVGTLGAGPPVPELARGTVPRGRTLFLYNCAPCHSSTGTGMILPDGAWAPELFDSTPTQVAEAIRIGPGPMPAFPESQLDKEHVEDIATYVQQLGAQQSLGGHPIDRLGPIAEGLVVWLLVMPLLVILIRLLGKKSPSKKGE